MQGKPSGPAPSFTDVLLRLERWGARQGWVGPDPFEGLNAPLGKLAASRRARQAVIQAYKRVPFSPPWPLRARPRPNAKALALALSAYSTPAGRALPGAEQFLISLPEELERLNLLAGKEAAWGYPFDAQTRHLFYDRRTPNAIATCFVVAGLLDAAAATGEGRHTELALRARPFLLSLAAEDDGGPYFSYVRAGSELIHNANLLVCGTLTRLNGLEPLTDVEDAVGRAVETTLRLQREDGLWDYGEAANLRWADNFHTVYILEGVLRVERAFGIGAAALKRGLAAWHERFFESDGWARYYPNSRFPLEAHCCASAIDLVYEVCGVGGGTELAELRSFGEEVAAIAIRELWLEDEGRFAYRRGARGLNRRTFMRWSNAPMFRALTRLASSRPSSDAGEAGYHSAVA